MYGFSSKDEVMSLAALSIYVVYKSRSDRFVTSTKMWGQITGFAKLAAKKSLTIPEFIERFRKPMKCDAVIPSACANTKSSSQAQILADGTIFVSGEEIREFAADIFGSCDDKKVIKKICDETSFVIMLVRERLENEKLKRIKN